MSLKLAYGRINLSFLIIIIINTKRLSAHALAAAFRQFLIYSTFVNVQSVDNIQCICVLSVLGKLRAAVGKAHLLTTKKFKQFIELCHRNLVSIA